MLFSKAGLSPAKARPLISYTVSPSEFTPLLVGGGTTSLEWSRPQKHSLLWLALSTSKETFALRPHD
jgi:hypothetical protein